MFDLSPTLVWLILGIILIAVEILTTTFVVLFFGVAAVLVALLKVIGLDNLTAEILIFSLLGLAGLILFRKKLLLKLSSTHAVDGLQNAQLILSADIAAHAAGAVTHQGTVWTAINETDQGMKKGDKVLIDRIDGVKLILRKID